MTQLPGFSTTSDQTDGFWFKDADTLYTADVGSATGGIRKYVFTDTNSDGIPDTWVFQYDIQLGVTGTVTPNANNGGVVTAAAITGMVDSSGNTDLFATSFEVWRHAESPLGNHRRRIGGGLHANAAGRLPRQTPPSAAWSFSRCPNPARSRCLPSARWESSDDED